MLNSSKTIVFLILNLKANLADFNCLMYKELEDICVNELSKSIVLEKKCIEDNKLTEYMLFLVPKGKIKRTSMIKKFFIELFNKYISQNSENKFRQYCVVQNDKATQPYYDKITCDIRNLFLALYQIYCSDQHDKNDFEFAMVYFIKYMVKKRNPVDFLLKNFNDKMLFMMIDNSSNNERDFSLLYSFFKSVCNYTSLSNKFFYFFFVMKFGDLSQKNTWSGSKFLSITQNKNLTYSNFIAYHFNFSIVSSQFNFYRINQKVFSMRKIQIFQKDRKLTNVFIEEKFPVYSINGLYDDIRLGYRFEFTNEAKYRELDKISFFVNNYDEKKTFKNSIKIKTLNNTYIFILYTVIYKNKMRQSDNVECLYSAFASLYYMKNVSFILHSRYHYIFNSVKNPYLIFDGFVTIGQKLKIYENILFTKITKNLQNLLCGPFFISDVDITLIYQFAHKYKFIYIHQDVFRRRISHKRFSLYILYNFVLNIIERSFCVINDVKVYHATIYKQHLYKDLGNKLGDMLYIKNLRIIDQINIVNVNEENINEFETILITFVFYTENIKQKCYFILPVKEQSLLNILTFFSSEKYLKSFYKKINFEYGKSNEEFPLVEILKHFLYKINVYANLKAISVQRPRKKFSHLFKCALYKSIEKHSAYEFKIRELKLDMQVFDWYECNDTYSKLYKRPGYRLICNFFAKDERLNALLDYLQVFFQSRYELFMRSISTKQCKKNIIYYLCNENIFFQQQAHDKIEKDFLLRIDNFCQEQDLGFSQNEYHIV
ncbi:hypothetical protein COBT_000372 [Conglomerata obtusa]